jgi:uncharacterized membrane protein
MNPFARLLTDQPLVLVHLVTASGALLLGLFLLMRRKGTINHRVLGWTWVALMAATVVTAAFIRDFKLPNIAGYTPIHLLVIVVPVLLVLGIVFARRGSARAHARTMKGLYLGACVTAGLFTLLPGRFLGQLLWAQLGVA